MSLFRRFKDRNCLRLLGGWIQFSAYLCEGTIQSLGLCAFLSSGLQCCFNRQCCTSVSIQREAIIFNESTGRRGNFLGPIDLWIKMCEGWDFLDDVAEDSFLQDATLVGKCIPTFRGKKLPSYPRVEWFIDCIDNRILFTRAIAQNIECRMIGWWARNELGKAVEGSDRALIWGDLRAFLFTDREDPRKYSAATVGASLNFRTAGLSNTSQIIYNVWIKLIVTFLKIRGFDVGWTDIIWIITPCCLAKL